MRAPPPPPIELARQVAIFDTECYPNYWLLKFRPIGGHVYTFSTHSGQSFSQRDIARIKLLFEVYTVVSFNGRGYDVPMITAVLIGYTVEQLKWLNDQIIVERVKPWELGLPEWYPADHIDVMEVAPGQGSQKQYAGRIHYRTMRDLPYAPSHYPTGDEIRNIEEYCENDLGQLEAIYNSLRPHINQRIALGKKYGLDLRSKSDAQVAEAVLKRRCEQATGRKIYKPEIDWNISFRYVPPAYITFSLPHLQHALDLIKSSVFQLGASGAVAMPKHLDGLSITIGNSTYKLGIGGLHSQETRTVHKSDNTYVIRDNDVASYYPALILNSGAWPPALGQTFLSEYESIINERLACKARVKDLKKAGFTDSSEYIEAKVGDDGGKIMINGTFGKTGSPYSILFAPEMLIQTTVTGQLSLLMLIEWHEQRGIAVISANTDGVIIKCRRDQVTLSEGLIRNWEKITGLTMETAEYRAVYSRDINNYFAIKVDGSVKRKGEYAKGGLDEKKNPDVEICSDAVAEYLANGTPILYTIGACRDIRKFVTIQKVSGGAVKMWGEGPRKGARVADMLETLISNGWVKEGRNWRKGDTLTRAGVAYEQCFSPQVPQYLGKVVRWYYSTQAPGPIEYASNGNTVSLSYGAMPCMTLPDEFPTDIDYQWYLTKADHILRDIGYYNLI